MNEDHISRVGKVILQGDTGAVSIALENRKSFGRVMIDSAAITLQVDVVLPEKEREIPEADFGPYSHVDLKFVAVHLTPEVTDILGATQTENFVVENVG